MPLNPFSAFLPSVSPQWLAVVFALALLVSLLTKFWLSSRQIRHVAQHRGEVQLAGLQRLARYLAEHPIPGQHRAGRSTAMNAYTPKTIAQYLDMLKDALKGADAALVQDALYDAEEYLRSELAANPAVARNHWPPPTAQSGG